MMDATPLFNAMDLTPIPLDYHQERVVPSFSAQVQQFPVTLNFYPNRKPRPSATDPLPVDFIPSPYSVICGRGKACTNAVGNRRLKVTASMFLEKYSKASTKEEKSMIVTEIMDIVEVACPDETGAFIRYDEGRWWVVDHMAAREKVGALLRDCLHTKYRSSTKSKLARRRSLKGSEDSTSSETELQNNSV
jgi:hypothetical protein